MRPNIVFFFADQQRWDTCGCYGQKLPVTPTLDRLAEEGTLFENAYTCQPVCGPARACLQTGKYATEVDCWRNAMSLPQDVQTLAGLFNDAGYDTAYVGKWHLASDTKSVSRAEPEAHYEITAVPPERRGGYRHWMAADVLEFTSHGYNGYVFDGDGNKREFIGYRADCITDFAIDYLHERDREKPFFLFLSHIEPHQQNDRKLCEGPDGSKRKFADFEVPGDLAPLQGDWEVNYPDYLGACNSLDYNLGRIIETLKDQGVWENTVLIYVSDHACHFCTRNSAYKRSCHAGSTHVPLVIHGPGFNTGERLDQMVSLMDLPVTLLECAGINRPDDWQGHSLKKLAAGETEGWPEEIFMQISESQIGRAIRTKEWTYSVRSEHFTFFDSRDADVYYEDFLYDLKNDPHELNNLAGDPAYADVRAELAVKLKKWMRVAGESEPEILPLSARPNP